jgi:hypothetical protein
MAINILPYGLLKMNAEYEGVVELSSNIGRIILSDPNTNLK